MLERGLTHGMRLREAPSAGYSLMGQFPLFSLLSFSNASVYQFT
jgi:hypothetical protein